MCDELSSLGTTFVGDLLEWAEEELDLYLKPVSPDRADPLHLERVLSVPQGVNLIDFQKLEEFLGSWVTEALTQADSLFGEIVDDPDAPDGSGKDIGANVFLRENVLDRDRALSVLIENLPFAAFDPVLFKSHDLLTETEITLVGGRIFGLDTFTRFDPLVGECGFRSCFFWLVRSHADQFPLLFVQLLASTPCRIPFISISLPWN